MDSLIGSLLTTKFSIPPTRHQSVDRPRLLARLEPTKLCALTLVVAPPGFGKTTLTAEWAQALPRNAVAWLTVDEDDNEPTHFLSYVIASLQALGSGLGHSAEKLLEGSIAVPARTIVAALINDIAAFREPIFLVIDDYHFITEQAIHDAIAYLLENLPANLRLVIATRVDPPLPLARLRARGQLSEIRIADLRFTLDETLLFFETIGLPLVKADILKLEARTEGWIAGLQLAALSLNERDEAFNHRFVTAFTGSHRHILDYLVDEVLERQPEHVQSFLLQTSVLTYLTPSLCDAVTGLSNSDDMLGYLDHANLFVIPLDDERQWYRYHHLFADVLRHRLQKRFPELAPILHARAAEWSKANGLYAEAVSHALAAGDTDGAAELVESVSHHLWTRRIMSDMHAWLKLLPQSAIESRPRLLLLDAQIQLFQGHIPLVQKRVHEAYQLLKSGGQIDPLLESEYITLKGMLENFTIGKGDALQLAEQALAQLPLEHPLRVIALLNSGIAHWVRGKLDAAEQQFRLTKDVALAMGNTYHAQVAMAYHAQVRLMRGKLREAEAIYHDALSLTPERWDLPDINGLFVGLGALRYEANDLEGAERDLERGVRLGEQEGNALVIIAGQLYQAFLAQAQHDTERSRQLTDAALQLAAKAGVGWLWTVPSVAARSSHLALLHGDLDTAAAWADSVLSGNSGLSNLLQREVEELAAARVLIADKRAELALPILDRIADEATRHGQAYYVLQSLLLRALAVKNAELAYGALERALAIGEPEGFIRVVIDEGDGMRRLLERYLHARPASSFRGYVSGLLRAFSGVSTGGLPAGQGLSEPLSERELEILGLMAQGLSNAEIASRFYLSVATVKKHGTNIFAKLEVNSRQDAVARARELRLIR